MSYRIQQYKKPLSLKYNREENHFGLTPLDPIEQEREAQLQEHRRRQEQGGRTLISNHKTKLFKGIQQKPFFQNKLKNKPKPLTFEENLERTYQWLGETFPFLFNLQKPHKVLNEHILRDVKQYHKHHLGISPKKNKYPENLIIKAALNRYMVSDNYLHLIKQGAQRHNLKGTECGTVTKEEEERAIYLLTLPLEQRDKDF